MTVAIEAAFRGNKATMATYFEEIKELGAVPEGPHPDPSCLFHWVTEDPNGYTVTDVWKNQAAFDKFLNEKVIPVSEKHGIPQPQIKHMDVANYCTAGA
jgi:quinol monooxygenase YgiN